jgi:predicted dehydrogenase
VDLVAVCDIRGDRRDAVRRQYPDVLVTATPEDAVDRAEAVVVATPAGTHASLTREILERDLPVLVEKPFALSVREAEALAELAERRGVPVLVGHLLLFHPAVERLKAMVGGGDLGDVYYLYSQRVNLGQVRPDENALWSFGPHDVSVALFLLDKAPTRVAAQGRSYLQPGIEDVVFMIMDFGGGPLAHVQMSWLDPHKERRLTVVGSRRMVVFDDMQPREKLKVYDKGVERPPEYTSYGESLAVREGDIAIPWIPSIEPLSAELRHFVDVARGATVPRSSAEDGVRVVRVLEAASRSLSSGGAAVTFARGHAA